MKSIFLSPDQIFRKQLSLLETVGTAAPASDLALLTVEDDGFVTDGPAINYYPGEGGCVDRFGTEHASEICAVRPATACWRKGRRASLSTASRTASL